MLWGITPVEARATHGIAVERLRGQIHAGLLLPEEKLPAERQLADDMGISRVTLRDALKVLEDGGYITIRRGAHGGAFVAGGSALDTLASRRTARDPAAAMRVLEFRVVNEAAAAKLAAHRRDLPELKRMRAAAESIAQAGSPALARQAAALFLLAMADGARNPLLAAAVRQGLSEFFEPAPLSVPEAPTWGLVAEAIARHDADGAAVAMASLHERLWARLRQQVTQAS